MRIVHCQNMRLATYVKLVIPNPKKYGSYVWQAIMLIYGFA